MNRKVINYLAIPLFIFFLLSVVDTYIGSFRSERVFRGVSGSRQFVSGKLDAPIDTGEKPRAEINEEAANKYLAYDTDSNFIHLNFLEVKGRIWRGELMIPNNSKSGDYSLCVRKKEEAATEATPVYLVRIFKDMNSYRAALPSFSERLIGIKPWWFTIGILPLALLCLYASYKWSGEDDENLKARGVGPIYKLAKRKKTKTWEIIFGLGTDHGVKEGDRLELLNGKLRPVGEITALKVNRESSTAVMDLGQDIRPDYHVAIRKEPSEIRE